MVVYGCTVTGSCWYCTVIPFRPSAASLGSPSPWIDSRRFSWLDCMKNKASSILFSPDVSMDGVSWWRNYANVGFISILGSKWCWFQELQGLLIWFRLIQFIVKIWIIGSS